jgi:amino acid adenylation domain-containing protein
MLMKSVKMKTPEILDLLPCTQMQEAMLFDYIVNKGSDLYLEQVCVNVDDPLDIPKLATAWNRIIDIHPALRTCYRWKKVKQPLQMVLKRFRLKIDCFDVASLVEEKKGQVLEDILENIRRDPFDLEHVPLRVAVAREAGGKQWMIVTYHHIVMDGWSNGIVLNQVLDCLRAPNVDDWSPVQVSPPFKSYVRWLGKVDQASQREYWLRYLRGVEEAAFLPARDKKGEGEGTGRYSLVLDEELGEALTRAAREVKTTVAAIVYSAWGLVLARYGDTDEVVFGTTVSGRPPELPEAERMVGLMINTLPLRISLTEDRTAAALWNDVSRDLEEREPFSYVSPADVNVEVDTVVVVENYPLDMTADVRFYERTHYQLTVLARLQDRIYIDLLYQSPAIGDELAADIGAALLRGLRFMSLSAVEPVSRCELMDVERKREIVLRFNDTAREGVSQMLFGDLWEDRVKREPQAVAVIAKKKGRRCRLTVEELDKGAERLAGYLAAKGCGGGDIVALMMERTGDLLMAMVAVLKLGAAYLPMDPGTPSQRVEFMLQDSDARLLVTDELFQEAMASGHGSYAGGGGANAVAYVIYTSGTTGRPKGVVIGHLALANFMAGIDDIIPFGRRDTILSLTTVSFDIFVLESLLPLSRGSVVCLGSGEEQLEPRKAAAMMAEHRVTMLQVTPSRLLAFLDNREFRGALAGLDILMVGGEPFPVQLIEDLSALDGEFRIFNMYGPTETTVWSTVKEIGSTAAGDIGFPIANTGLYILNGRLELLPLGAPGDLYIGGLGLADGYLNRAELTAESFITLDAGHFGVETPKLRLYKTGDAAYWERDGSVSFIGRRDQQVKIRGFRIEPQEIEHALCRHSRVKEAVVTPRQSVDSGLELWAYVVVEGGELPDNLPAFLADNLPAYMIPVGFVAVESIPLTANGKIDRRALAALDATTASNSAEPEEPGGPVSSHEHLVMGIWRQVLGREQVPMDSPFFEIGGNSLLLIRVHSRLLEAVDVELPIAALFRYPTVRRLAAYLGRETDGEEAAEEKVAVESAVGPVAVIGMAARVPGAWNVAQFWENLCNGIESVRRFDEGELLEAGAGGEIIRDPLFVNAKGILPGYDLFAAEFFDYSSREAEMMDPQLRILHELAWEALEDACIDPFSYTGRIGLFAAAMENTEWLNFFRKQAQSHSQWMGAWSLSDRDFLATRVAFALNLRGPALTVQTACSSSLVAVDEAVQALRSRRADVVLAGGVSFTMADQWGYPYEEGMVRSPKGQCRPFDREAAGTVGGNGGGLVVLKLLEHVDPRFEHVEAIIKGSAVNNDGMDKMGYTAPSVEGQASVIRQALRTAGIDPQTIGYVEAHGTGTKLGDPVEIEGLRAAYRLSETGIIAIGSLKGNVGHLDTAAGVAGLIKAVLMVREGKMPAGLHVDEPNPVIGFQNTPFFVNIRLRDWEAGETLRRAAVSSFGIGGTNAHVIVEQAAPVLDGAAKKEEESGRRQRLLLLSAKNETALGDLAGRTADYLKGGGESCLDDVSVTLQVGRRHFSRRWAGVASGPDEAVGMLGDRDSLLSNVNRLPEGERAIVFMFPGQGAQYAGMAADLYRDEPVFRRHLDRCIELLKRYSPLDFVEVNDETLRRTELAQPMLFAVEYALARLLMEWGTRPSVMMGHSIGEWTAACLAGVLELEEALNMVALRGRLMQAQPEGSMLAVQESDQKLEPVLRQFPEVSVAAVNTPGMCVLSGETGALDRLEARLTEQGMVCRSLHTSHAFHSAMMEPVREALVKELRGVSLHEPKIPFVSNVTGQLITGPQATDPDYWARHLREPVQWAAGLETVMNMEHALFIEVGPGRTLSTFAARHPQNKGRFPAIQLIKHPQDSIQQDRFFYNQIGKLWLHGAAIDWRAFNCFDTGCCVSLPTYPFLRQRYWPEGLKGGAIKHLATDGWLYHAGWKEAPVEAPEEEVPVQGQWLALGEVAAEPLVRLLKQRGCDVIQVMAGTEFGGSVDNGFTMDPGDPLHFKRLLEEVGERFSGGLQVAHLWGLQTEELDLTLHFYSLIYLAQAWQALDREVPLKIRVVTSGHPAGALATGPALVFPLEFPAAEIGWIDIDPKLDRWEEILRELDHDQKNPLIQLREGKRYIPEYRAVEPAACRNPLPLKPGGTYVVTGGLGALGRTVVEYLVQSWDAAVVLVNHSPIPVKEAWENTLQMPGTSPEMRRRIQFLQDLECQGAKLLCLTADVADRRELDEALEGARQRFGKIRGIFHCAGVADGRLTPLLTEQWARRIMAPKVQGLLALDQWARVHPPDFIVAFSSINTVASSAGQTCYTSANAFMDAFCQWRNRQSNGAPLYMSLDWDAWTEGGMAVSTDLGIERLDHPLFYSRKQERGTVIYQSRLQAEDCWWLAQHRVGDRCLLPGTAYLELAAHGAAMHIGRSAGLRMRDVVFHAPLFVAAGQEVVVRTDLQEEEGGFRFFIRSPQGAGEAETVHASGFCEWTESNRTNHWVVEELIDGVVAVELRHNGGIEYGERWNSIERVLAGNRKAVANISLPSQFQRDLETSILHPALLDVATMFAWWCFPDVGENLVPFGYGTVSIYGAIPSRVLAVAERRDEFDDNAETLTLDVWLLTPEGRPIASVEGFVMKTVPPEGREGQANEGLFINKPGDLESLEFRSVSRQEPSQGEVEVEIAATGLNYKEVLVALGVLPPPEEADLSFGLECSGVVSALGPGVTEFAVGDEVIGYGDSLFGRYRCLPAAQVARKPLNVRLHEAAAIPLAYLTAYYGLVEYGGLQKGERVLIHSASGGVGQAAVTIAGYCGAEIFATAGSEEKREFLRSSGIRHVMDSRSPEFAQQVMMATDGQGVDLVLNSLSGELLDLGLSVLAAHGRFVELGLRDIVENRSLGLKIFKKGITFKGLQVSSGIPGLGEVFRRIARHIEAGDFQPPMVRVFEKPEAASAFRLMAGSRHMGKLVVARKGDGGLTGERRGLTHSQGLEALLQALRLKEPRLVVTPRSLDNRSANGQKKVAPSQPRSQPPLHSRPALAVAFEPPGSKMEELLAEIFREFLGLEQIGVQDNFFELGATSLDMIQVGNRLKSELKREIPVVKLFDHPTVRALADYLSRDEGGRKPMDGPDAGTESVKRGKERLKQRRQKRRGQ